MKHMIDAQKVKQLLFDDIELVLVNLKLDYEVSGDNVYSTCPVHDGSDNNKAFSLSLDKQMWRCWTRDCQGDYGADIFGLIKGVLSQQEGKEVGFKEALRWACKILNIDSKDVDFSKREEPNDFVKLVDFFSSNPEFVHQPSKAKYKLQHPSEYFVFRGFSEETLLHFEVGDCLDKSSPMYQRAVIPIHDDSGENVVGHIGRSVKEYREPKFLFTKGFDKRHFLYNYHRAIDRAVEKRCLFITEGQGDVWKLHEAGINNAVSVFGKSLSLYQKKKIQRSGVTSLIILTDNDQAGRESKMQIQRELGRMFKLVFPRWKQKDIGDMRIDQVKETILSQVEGTF